MRHEQNDTDVLPYKFDLVLCKSIGITFGRNVAERVSYQTVIYFSTYTLADLGFFRGGATLGTRASEESEH